MPNKIAVTGGIGSGKSAVCRILKERGYPVFSCDEINRTLRDYLPKYMLPNLFRQMDRLPYNANGKVDRVALKEAYFHESDS